MNHDLFRLPLLFIILCAVQVFVLNHCQLFGCAMPMLYVYFVISMKKGMAKWAMMVWAFALGLLLDTFSNTPGVTAATMTLAAMVQPGKAAMTSFPRNRRSAPSLSSTIRS